MTNYRQVSILEDYMSRIHDKVIVMVIIGFILSLTLGACESTAPQEQRTLTLAPEDVLPDYIRAAPPDIQEAYRFAIANPEIVSAFPCYCGCGAMGHESNLDCYIKEILPDGTIVFEDHALG